MSKGPKVTGLTGELAIQKAGKNTRKKLLEEQKKAEMESLALKERVKKANLDREEERKQKERDARNEERQAKKR